MLRSIMVNKMHEGECEMILGASGDNQFLFEIKDYQYPGNRNNEFDANWLYITIGVDTPQWSWKKTDPSLLTWEVQSLIDWLEAVVINQEEWNCINFTEPNLSFCIRGKGPHRIILGLHLALESRPPFLVGGVEDPDIIEIECDREELGQWIDYLKDELAKYPLVGVFNEELTGSLGGDFTED